MLIREAKRLGYPLRLLRLAIATYKMPRVVRVGTAYSDLVWATRGIVAGSGNATSEMRLVMIDIVDSVMKHHPTVIPTLFVDDLSIELTGDDDQAGSLPSCTAMLGGGRPIDAASPTASGKCGGGSERRTRRSRA